MKKIAITSLVALFAVSAANAGEWYVGGSAGLLKQKDVDATYVLAPEVGYHLNDKWDIGAELVIGQYKIEDEINAGVFYDATDLAIAPYARYEIAKFGNFEVLLKGSIALSNTSVDTGNVEVDSTELGITIAPMVTYALNENFVLHAQLNFLGAGFGYNFDSKGWALAAGVDANDVLNTGDFQIGFTYNF